MQSQTHAGVREFDCLIEAMRLVSALKSRGLKVTLSQTTRRSLYVVWQR